MPRTIKVNWVLSDSDESSPPSTPSTITDQLLSDSSSIITPSSVGDDLQTNPSQTITITDTLTPVISEAESISTLTGILNNMETISSVDEQLLPAINVNEPNPSTSENILSKNTPSKSCIIISN